MQTVIDHANRRGAAARQTFDKLDAVISVSANGNRRVSRACGTTGSSLNSRGRAQIFHHLITSSHRATERATNPDVRFAGAFFAQHWIKRDQLENIDRLKSELLRDPGHRVIVKEIEMLVPKMPQ